ncbi:EamA family transporter [Xylophilus sp. Kf1]|nr:EamA family transporter [Xylophilus sp. Kf1]
MSQRLSPSTVLLLCLPSLAWAGNAVVGRLLHDLVSPMTLNFLRWSLALLILLPLAHGVFRRGSPLWPQWRYYTTLGLLGIGSYNALQYLALQTSQPLNTTLVGSGTPFWILIVGRVFFGATTRRMEWIGAVVSIAGVLTVLSRGSVPALLELHLVPGDAFMVLATITWAFYAWKLVRPPSGEDVPRHDWSAFLAAQVLFGVLWSGGFAAAEWGFGRGHVEWSWVLAAGVGFISVFAALVAFRAYGASIRRVGPKIATFFGNLTPLFTAVLSAALLGERPQLYHGVAFLLIVGGIVVSSRR